MQGLCLEAGRRKPRAQAHPWENKFKLSVEQAGGFRAEKMWLFIYLIDIEANLNIWVKLPHLLPYCRAGQEAWAQVWFPGQAPQPESQPLKGMAIR